MCSIQELPEVKTRILEKVKLSAQGADISAISKWSKAVEQCEKFIQESSDLTTRIKNFTEALWQTHEITFDEQSITGKPKLKLSPKLEGLKARREWVNMLSSKAILLNGHNKRYYTESGQSVSIAFANEIDRPNLIDKWFLGLKDEPTDIAVLLCQDLKGKVNDFVLPVAELKSIWKTLGRSRGGIKFHVRHRQGQYLLSVPNGEPINISKYIGKYQTIK